MPKKSRENLHGCRVFSQATLDHGLATWMDFDKIGDIVYNTRNGDKIAAILSLILEIVPSQYW